MSDTTGDGRNADSLRSIADLARRSFDDAADLAQAHADMMRAEMAANGREFAAGAALLIAAAVALCVTLGFLGVVAFEALKLAGLSPIAAAAVGCLAFAALAVGLGLAGKAKLGAASALPVRSFEQMKRSVATLFAGAKS